VIIAGTDATEVDLTFQSNLSPEERDAKILTLAKSGDKMGAVKLTRQIYGATLSEAVAFVEKLQSRG
jgi:ribosomal protein L7/L12